MRVLVQMCYKCEQLLSCTANQALALSWPLMVWGGGCSLVVVSFIPLAIGQRYSIARVGRSVVFFVSCKPAMDIIAIM